MFTTQQVGEMFYLHPTTVKYWARKLGVQKAGRAWVWTEKDIRRLQKEQERKDEEK